MVEPAKKKESTARRDRLIELETEAQAFWGDNKFYESNGNEASPQEKKKYFITFPYPYMNGKLHLGHAFSMSKCEFTARYKRLQGYNVLWPFAFHCTGMPINAAANRIKSEIEQNIQQKENKDGTQYAIMKQMGISDEEIPKFQDPTTWLEFFSPMSREHLKKFGVHVDWRRSFITTEYNPYYNSFIEWQFQVLREQNRISFGKRPSIFSVKDNQICADHDRSEGEGVNPQEYTLIKLKILEPYPEEMAALKGRNVFLVAATLRPETMYGQTNCFILPTGVYGAFEMKNNEVFVCSDRSALNMAYQGVTRTPEKVEKIIDIQGQTLLGLPLKAPLSVYDRVYSLPMLTISMGKGTGVVTSVPSDAPDDFATLRDLKKKADLRSKFNIKDEMVLPFDPVPIIEIPGYSTLSAEKACDEFKVTSQNDKEKLVAAKDKVYLKGFNEGIMIIGNFKGAKVKDAKNLVRKEMIEQGLAEIYFEPESKVVSRSKEECIVSLCDQWYLNYGEEEWKKAVANHVNAGFNTYNDNLLKELLFTIDWLKEWGCSRNFGMGTRLPWDKKFLIESLSDSTIYMSYYTIAHFLQGDLNGKVKGTLDIDVQDISRCDWDYIFRSKPYDPNSKIPEEKLKIMKAEFLYWYPMDLRCSGKDLIKNHLTMSLFNHASIWSHDNSLWPRAFFCNGYVLVEGEKMSKSKGNFITLEDCMNFYGTDASRIALADAGDTLDDANFTKENANSAILKLSTLEAFIREVAKGMKDYRTDSPNESLAFADRVFENQLYDIYLNSIECYEAMKFRDVLKMCFFELVSIKDDYKINYGTFGPRRDLIAKYLEYQLLLLYPIAPHFCEILYKDCFYPSVENKEGLPKFISLARYPNFKKDKIDYPLLRMYSYLKSTLRSVRLAVEKAKSSKKKGKDQAEVVFTKCILIFANEYPAWQKNVLSHMNKLTFNEKKEPVDDWKSMIKGDNLPGDVMKKSLQFGAFVLAEFKERGKEALELNLPFSERDFIVKHKEAIAKDAGVGTVELLDTEEAAKRNSAQINQLLQNTLPGKPQIILE